jgi:histidine ammonia-lyase
MTVVLERRGDIDLDCVYRVAWQGKGVRIASAALERIAACQKSFLTLIDRDDAPFVYGVTSGYGASAKHRLDSEGRRRQAEMRVVNQAVSIGEALPERVARAIVLARLANYLEGHAAVSAPFVEGVAAELDKPPLPRIPMLGNACAGEINALGHLFSRFSRDYRFQPKEGNALTNGSPCASALIADAAIAARRRVSLAEQVFAFAIEAFKAPLEHYDPIFSELWEDPYISESLQALQRHLEGAGAERRPYQAPVSFRIIPQMLAQMRRATWAAEEVASRSLASITDNPVYLPPDEDHPYGRCLSNGGFHNAQATAGLDDLAAVWADLCLLCERQTARLHDGALSGLPHWLPESEGFEPYRYVPYAITAFGEQARRAAQRTFLPGNEGAGFGQTDVVSPVFLAWEGADKAGYCLDASLAGLAVVALHALRLTGRAAPRGLADFAAGLQELVPAPNRLEPAAKDIEAVAEAFKARIYAVDGDRS